MNKALFKWHGRLALLSFVPLLVICTTGSLLVFKHELDRWLMPNKVRVAQVADARLPLDELRERIHGEVPGHEIVGWVLFQDPGRADLVYVMEEGTSDWSYVLLDQYSGRLLAEPRGITHYLTDWLLDLHYAFLWHEGGLAVTSLFAVVLCVLGISGLIMHRRFWKNLFRIRRKARRVVYFSDLHKTVGTLASPILLVLGFTGAWWNIQELVHEYEHLRDGEEHHVMRERLYNDELSLGGLLDRAAGEIEGFTPTYVSMPYEPGLPITVYGDVPDANPLISQYASYASFDAGDGELQAQQDIRQAGPGARVLDSYRRLHFGNFGGLISRILWAVAGMMPLVLAVTGVSLWFLRRGKKRRARENRLRREG